MCSFSRFFYFSVLFHIFASMLNATIRKKIILLLCIVIFTSYYTGTSFFFHTHIINGTTIVHSHIHADSHHNTQNGDHTEYNFTLIAQLSHFEYIDSPFVDASHTTFLLNELYFVETTRCKTSIYLENTLLRGPPFV
jgi:hypothetical protein